eukprot:4257721-Amphidinium_carterae.2
MPQCCQRGSCHAGVWHEKRTHRAFAVGDLCVRCREEVEDLPHIIFRCPRWKKRGARWSYWRTTVPACVNKLHGLLPAPLLPAILTHEPALVYRANVRTVWTDRSGKHSSDPHHRRAYRAEVLVKAVQALQTGRRNPKGGNRDLEKRALAALLPGQQIRRMKAHLKQADVDSGRITADDLHGNGQADDLANQGTVAHGLPEPDATKLGSVGPKLRTKCITVGAQSDLNFVNGQMTNPGSGYRPKLWKNHPLQVPKERRTRTRLSMART